MQSSFMKEITMDAAKQVALGKGIKDKNLSELAPFFSAIKEDLDTKYRGVILHLEDEAANTFSHQELVNAPELISSFFGELLVQNEKGDKVIMVYDRDRLGSMYQGARYHQTREGGSIHTDNVNIPEIWNYLFLSCIEPAQVGGENILVDGVAVHKTLKEKYPKALAVLEDNFTWEMRGVSDSLYEAPIITYDENGLPLFRHLRPYMESAHVKANKPLSFEQLYAIDVLDAVTNSSEYQMRYRMRKGDILITRDAQVLHGRTCFSDAIEAVTYDDYIQGKGAILKRTMERLWIK
ncbi:MAG: hypothetical protein COW00_19915 [Bdellovibrio sp. CG12_big_fil_rev_8_21_14_0_65_39_13]|nr:MAG: hypothetical protein COW78_02090 [Bdellovibrio sp. CG22_combo_CG10-13_8_21_14_all_39_27]PIQ57641.1 MAG: hypothetical protein COW00_19915 [Bdellovibrio sp. CG12_big_fil_rev_8_21_14_0_65_39_13]PIR35805.1 MAG: hypothetical protein COV37_06295 [Bdellovibrio sp. CG11_big_fil_rev_8_21_14_0_20_39_38]PJB53512.1 MAG: hypothetical protein CO099_06650 [Bdellovibrio sp. CG_4_9_14_3_um_filter_39_7]